MTSAQPFGPNDAWRGRDEQVPLLPAPDEDCAWHEREQGETEDHPRAERAQELVVREPLPAGQRRDRADEDEDEPHPETEPGETLAAAQKLRGESERDAEVEGREHEQRHDLEQDDSTVVTHWAP